MKRETRDANKRVSALDAAAVVLAEADGPLTTREIVKRMEVRGLWKSPGGKTPQATLYAALMREINSKPRPRFKRDGRGTFSLDGGTEAASKGA